MPQKKLGAAIFGAGWVAGQHARAYQNCPRTELVAIGRPYYIEVDYWHGKTKNRQGSSLLAAGGHAVDALRWFAGIENEVIEVFAHSIPRLGHDLNWDFEPTTVFLCKFADGTVGKVSSALDCVMPYSFNVDVLGTRGTIRDNRLWSEELFPGQTDWATIPTVLPDSGDVAHHPFDGQIEALVAAILDDVPCLPDVDDAVKTHQLIFAADLAARTGGPMRFACES